MRKRTFVPRQTHPPTSLCPYPSNEFKVCERERESVVCILGLSTLLWPSGMPDAVERVRVRVFTFCI